MYIQKLIKKQRDKMGLTQAELAKTIGVTIETIRSWEKNILPDKKYINILIDVLKMQPSDFDKYYIYHQTIKDTIYESEQMVGFKNFVFPENYLEEIRKIKFSQEEQELLGFLLINGKWISKKCDNFSLQTKIPIEFANKHGSIKSINIMYSLYEKIKIHPELITNKIIEKKGKLFSYTSFNDDDIIKLLKQKTYTIYKNNINEVKTLYQIYEDILKINSLMINNQIILDKNNEMFDWINLEKDDKNKEIFNIYKNCFILMKKNKYTYVILSFEGKELINWLNENIKK